MDWKLELDALIKSTMAFAKDVKRPIDFRFSSGGQDSRASACRHIEAYPTSSCHYVDDAAKVRTR